MLSVLSVRKSFSLAGFAAGAALAAALLTSCSTPPAAPIAPPPPPAPPPIALSGAVLQSAAGYQAYMNHVAGMKAEFHSGEDVAQSLKYGYGYDPQRLLEGAIAYGAVAALQDQTFVNSLRTFAADPDSRQQMTRSIFADPNYATGIKGADTAAGLAIAAMMDQGQRVYAAGAAVKQSAYDIQHQAWSKEQVLNRDQRLMDAKNVPSVGMSSSAEDVTRLQQAALGVTPLGLTGQAATAPYPPAVVRALAVAALAALGQAGDDNNALVMPLMTDQASSACLNMAKLNLYQCLAVSRPHYEDVFCLGQHVMMDTGQCMMIAAGAPPPVVAPAVVSKTEVAYGAKPATTKKKRRAKASGT